ncbi:lipoprotein 17-related variable surface protein [[Mycoplasma] testudinis]|uniref:lipoprotein 17-related variable surface protein n=1 Tax=[Mycoplasma] testudinis TaxID=33924 RepID=UPI00048173C8|nr:lipoprotein 17-related variable surface protein [[Mycoplasma] testudinis]
MKKTKRKTWIFAGILGLSPIIALTVGACGNNSDLTNHKDNTQSNAKPTSTSSDSTQTNLQHSQNIEINTYLNNLTDDFNTKYKNELASSFMNKNSNIDLGVIIPELPKDLKNSGYTTKLSVLNNTSDNNQGSLRVVIEIKKDQKVIKTSDPIKISGFKTYQDLITNYINQLKPVVKTNLSNLLPSEIKDTNLSKLGIILPPLDPILVKAGYGIKLSNLSLSNQDGFIKDNLIITYQQQPLTQFNKEFKVVGFQTTLSRDKQIQERDESLITNYINKLKNEYSIDSNTHDLPSGVKYATTLDGIDFALPEINEVLTNEGYNIGFKVLNADDKKGILTINVFVQKNNQIVGPTKNINISGYNTIYKNEIKDFYNKLILKYNEDSTNNEINIQTDNTQRAAEDIFDNWNTTNPTIDQVNSIIPNKFQLPNLPSDLVSAGYKINLTKWSVQPIDQKQYNNISTITGSLVIEDNQGQFYNLFGKVNNYLPIHITLTGFSDAPQMIQKFYQKFVTGYRINSDYENQSPNSILSNLKSLGLKMNTPISIAVTKQLNDIVGSDPSSPDSFWNVPFGLQIKGYQLKMEDVTTDDSSISGYIYFTDKQGNRINYQGRIDKSNKWHQSFVLYILKTTLPSNS